MLQEMSAQQLSEWIAYYQIEPFGILADDMIAAHWKAIYCNSNRKKGKRAEKVQKFLTFQEKKADASHLYDEDDESCQMSETLPQN